MNIKQIHIVGISAIALSGIGVGCLIGYFLGKKSATDDEEYEEREEIKVVETYSEDEEPSKFECIELINGYSKPKHIETEPIDVANYYLGYSCETDEDGDTSMSYSYTEKEQIPFDYDEDEDLEEPESDVEYTSDQPFLVAEEDIFYTGMNPNDISQLTYYQEDDVLVDSFGEIVTNRVAVVGSEFQDNFGYGSNDDTVVYIRNPKTKRDYEITLELGSYEMEVLEADEEQYRNARKYFSIGE